MVNSYLSENLASIRLIVSEKLLFTEGRRRMDGQMDDGHPLHGISSADTVNRFALACSCN